MTPDIKVIHKRGSWSAQEDQKLLELVEDAKSVRWVNIAELLGTRTSKQCRERYHQNLKPSLNHSPITPEEAKQIDHLVTIYGKRWAEISRHLKGRSDNAIKNWWNASANRRKSQSWHNGSISGSISGPPDHRGSVSGMHSARGSVSGPHVPASVPHSRSGSVDMIRRHSLHPEFPRTHSIGGWQQAPMPPQHPLHPQAQPHVAPQVEVVFNPSYQETYTPPAVPSPHTSLGGGTPAEPCEPSQHPLSGPFAPMAPIQPIAPHATAPHVGPMAPVAPVPPAAPHVGPHAPPATNFYQSHHQTPYSRRESRRESRIESLLDSHRDSRRNSRIENLMEPPEPRLPAIAPFLEEQFRTMRRQSHDSKDLLRYSLSMGPQPPSPESRRSSAAYPPGPSYHSPRPLSPLPGFNTIVAALPTRTEN